jgi:dTDP-4-amino-4,6-dideoxygalactose transaminase
VPAIRTPVVAAGNEHVYNQYTVRVRRRDEVRARLEEAGIGTGVYYPVPLHLQQCFAELGYGGGDLPVTERAVHEVLSLPVFPELTTEQQAMVIEELTSAATEEDVST